MFSYRGFAKTNTVVLGWLCLAKALPVQKLYYLILHHYYYTSLTNGSKDTEGNCLCVTSQYWILQNDIDAQCASEASNLTSLAS